MSDLNTLIQQLNTILSWELAGTIQYLHHHAMLMGPERESFAEFFHDGSKEARSHAELVANKITVLGGVPTVEPARIEQATTLDEMLHAALRLEQSALAAWEAAHPHGGAANMGTTFWLEEMIAHEQEHVDALMKLTGGVKRVAQSQGDASTQAG